MNRALKITLVGLAVLLVVAAISWRGLRQRLTRAPSPAQAQRALVEAPATSPAAPLVPVRLYWAAPEDEGRGRLAPVEIQLPLAEDPEQRARQVLNALIVDAPSPQHRTLPLELTLLAFYLLPDGSAVADFSHDLATATPSGILSEQMAVDSIARTLEANLPAVRRLKILIQGQEQETLAGHLDLTGWIELQRAAAP
ncbi:MAG: GerMN domain-containing protein [Firmicutes bacterium]|nr:GerMN domain-containing protein [Bacillota bacterium]